MYYRYTIVTVSESSEIYKWLEDMIGDDSTIVNQKKELELRLGHEETGAVDIWYRHYHKDNNKNKKTTFLYSVSAGSESQVRIFKPIISNIISSFWMTFDTFKSFILISLNILIKTNIFKWDSYVTFKKYPGISGSNQSK